MSTFQPPPTWANPVLVDEATGKGAFNPVWLKWFIELSAGLDATGGGSGTVIGVPVTTPGHMASWQDAAATVLGDGGVIGGAAHLDVGSIAGTVCAGDDARLSDARTPTAHAASHDAGGADALAIDAVAATGSLRTLGTAATSACAGNDARLSDSRTPTSHAISSHSGLPLDVTGSRGGNAALASLLTQLASLGLITDSTT